MEDQNIRKWVRQKLDEGQSQQPLKKALENQGLDPSIVDEVARNRQNSNSEQNGFEIPDLDILKYGKPFLLLVLIGGLVFGAATLIDSKTFDFSSPLNSNQPADDGVDEEEGPVKVVLENGFATPARPEINPSRHVEFVNQENHSLKMVFERNVETFTLESGQSKTVDINDLVYYSAEPVDQELGSIDGSVDVQ